MRLETENVKETEASKELVRELLADDVSVEVLPMPITNCQ